MILEVAILNVIAEKPEEFEDTFSTAQNIISSVKGYKWHQLQRYIEVPNRHILLVQWETLEDHTVGFRQSAEYLEWKKLLHPFYDPSPTVECYKKIA